MKKIKITLDDIIEDRISLVKQHLGLLQIRFSQMSREEKVKHLLLALKHIEEILKLYGCEGEVKVKVVFENEKESKVDKG